MIYLLHQTIDQVAAQYPTKEALRFKKRTLTFADLSTLTNKLANCLIEHGVKRRDRVGIYLNKSIESAVAIYGIMKAGAAYVPLDPSAPVSRLSFVIRDCGIRHIITNVNNRDALSNILAATTNVDCVVGIEPLEDRTIRCVSWDDVGLYSGEKVPATGTIEQDLAYIMYTSGSTGDPKGIMHTHHSGLSYAKWAANAYALSSNDNLSNHAPLHFDLSTFDFFAGALAGATTIIVPEEYTRLPASYSNLLADQKISVFFTVPFALIQLLQRGMLASRDLSSLRWIIFGGEPFPTKYLKALMKLLPHTHFSNMYGPAETNGCTYFNIPPLPDSYDDPIPIGTVCPNAEALVVYENNQPVNDGESGELLIRGPTMMQGYWGRPDLNKKAFYRRRVFADHYDVFYRTGDIVQRMSDGNFSFLGRKDRQIKIRGYRIELDEVEMVLVSHVWVEEAAVYPVPDQEGVNTIEGAVRLQREATVTPPELIAYMKDRLPWYAIPKNIMFMDEFPRTTSGKISRRELQKFAAKGPSACSKFPVGKE